ncbi:zinc finger, CCHC-type containing protein [Tanacetum coccineum]
MLEMSKDDLIPAIDENTRKCNTCNKKVPNKRNKTIPNELWYKKRPNLSFLRVWDCWAVVTLPDPKRKILGEKGIDCVFVGYAEHSKAYRFYVIEPNDSVSINSIIESRDAIFDENRFSSIPRPKNIIPNSDESQRDDHSNDVPSESPKPRREAIDDEIGSIMENNTRVLSDLPPGYKPLGCKCIFKRKMKVDGTINNYSQSSDPSNGCQTTFLNGDLEEEVYMKQLEGFVMPSNEHKVCKLVKSLYGLKQAPNKFDGSGKGVIICLYVDDILIFGTDQYQVDKTKKFLSSKFLMKDMGEADVILSIKIKRENIGIVITQSYYIDKILKKFNREDCSLVSTPIDAVEKLKPNTGKPVDQLKYIRAICCLMYDMTSTRPDIAYGKL